MKRAVAVIAVLILAAGAWWFSRPKPDDRAQILGHLETIRRSAQTDSPRGITGLLSENFTWNGLNRREINSQLTGFFWTYDAVDLQFEGLVVDVKGEIAVSSGRYVVKYRSAPDQPFETRRGEFRLDWRGIEGEWKIQSASGGENLNP